MLLLLVVVLKMKEEERSLGGWIQYGDEVVLLLVVESDAPAQVVNVVAHYTQFTQIYYIKIISHAASQSFTVCFSSTSSPSITTK